MMHPSTSNILQFFKYDHLPMHLQSVSQPFSMLAQVIANDYEGPEVTACLRKLLEAKDCAVRAALTTTRPSYEKEVGEPQYGGPLTEEQQRDFNSAQAELTRLRQKRHMEMEEQAKRDPSGTDDDLSNDPNDEVKGAPEHEHGLSREANDAIYPVHDDPQA